MIGPDQDWVDDQRAEHQSGGVGNHAPPACSGDTSRPTPEPYAREAEAKLRRDAANVLTWEPPSDGDPLLFAHLQRFAKATIRALDLARAGLSDRERLREELASVAELLEMWAIRANPESVLALAGAIRRGQEAGTKCSGLPQKEEPTR